MSQLVACPACSRHVRQTETSCPFCSTALSLADLPAPPLPRGRLGRAATFAFGATLVGATALVGCGGDAEGGKEDEGDTGGNSPIPVYGAPAAGNGGESQGGGNIYGAPPAGGGGAGGAAGNASGGGGGVAGKAGAGGAAGKAGAGGGGAGGANVGPVYGAPAAGSSGSGNAPVYGAPP